MLPFSALAFFRAKNIDNPTKKMNNEPHLKQPTMGDSPQCKSNRLPKPITFFDERINKNAPTKGPTRGTTKPPAKPPTKSPTNLPTIPPKALAKAKAKAPAKTSTENEEAILQEHCDNQLCEQISLLAIDEGEGEGEGEDQQDPKPNSKATTATLKALKKAKEKEVARLTKLNFNTIIEEVKDPKDTPFTPFKLGRHRNPEVVNIPPYIDSSKPLDLLDLFIPPEMYAILAENTNKYAVVKNARMDQTTTNTRF
jgi:hypothetical protein